MNANELRARFPRASESFIRENSVPECPVSHASLERDKASALGVAVPREKSRMARITVRFTGFRVRPLDPDGFAGSVKDLLDGLRHAHLLPSDDLWTIRLESEQERVATFAEERTEIKIEYP